MRGSFSENPQLDRILANSEKVDHMRRVINRTIGLVESLPAKPLAEADFAVGEKPQLFWNVFAKGRRNRVVCRIGGLNDEDNFLLVKRLEDLSAPLAFGENKSTFDQVPLKYIGPVYGSLGRVWSELGDQLDLHAQMAKLDDRLKSAAA